MARQKRLPNPEGYSLREALLDAGVVDVKGHLARAYTALTAAPRLDVRDFRVIREEKRRWTGKNIGSAGPAPSDYSQKMTAPLTAAFRRERVIKR